MCFGGGFGVGFFSFQRKKNTPRSLFLPFFCAVARRAPVWPCSASAFPRKALGLLFPHPAVRGAKNRTWRAQGAPTGTAGMSALFLVQLPGRGGDSPNHPPAAALADAGSGAGRGGGRGGDMGRDTQPLTCRSDLHRARAHLRQPLQADAVLHRPGDRAVPGGGEAAR